MEKKRCYICKERGHITYDYPKRGKITVISENMSEEKWQLGERVVISKIKERSLFISPSFISRDLFCESFFTIQCILKNKIKAITLVDIYTIGFWLY